MNGRLQGYFRQHKTMKATWWSDVHRSEIANFWFDNSQNILAHDALILKNSVGTMRKKSI
jgi:hypothetical protein